MYSSYIIINAETNGEMDPNIYFGVPLIEISGRKPQPIINGVKIFEIAHKTSRKLKSISTCLTLPVLRFPSW